MAGQGIQPSTLCAISPSAAKRSRAASPSNAAGQLTEGVGTAINFVREIPRQIQIRWQVPMIRAKTGAGRPLDVSCRRRDNVASHWMLPLARISAANVTL